MNNISYIWEPHYMSGCVRVDVNKQQSDDWNFVIVCCSPLYNGSYRWKGTDRDKWETVKNGKITCYCIPLTQLEKSPKSLHELPDIYKPMIKQTQEDWFNFGKRKNRPDWFLDKEESPF